MVSSSTGQHVRGQAHDEGSSSGDQIGLVVRVSGSPSGQTNTCRLAAPVGASPCVLRQPLVVRSPAVPRSNESRVVSELPTPRVFPSRAGAVPLGFSGCQRQLASRRPGRLAPRLDRRKHPLHNGSLELTSGQRAYTVLVLPWPLAAQFMR